MITAIAAIVISIWTQHSQQLYKQKNDNRKSLDAALESIGSKDSLARQLSRI